MQDATFFLRWTPLVAETFTEEDRRILVGVSNLSDGVAGTICPVTAQDAASAAFRHILGVYCTLPNNLRYIIGLDGEVDADFLGSVYRTVPEPIRDRTLIVWNEGLRVRRLREQIADSFEMKIAKKGGNVFTSIGLLKTLRVGSVVIHDGDIVNFGKRFITRLIDPLIRPTRRKKFVKADFTRVGFLNPKGGPFFGEDFEAAVRSADPRDLKLNARGCRLLAKPLFRAGASLFPEWKSLRRMGAFGYPLSGEFGADTGSLMELELGNDYALETVMAVDWGEDAWRRYVEEAHLGLYEHKHTADLTDMCRQIIETLIGLIAPRSHRFFERVGELPIRYSAAADAAINFWADFASGHRLSWNEAGEREIVQQNASLLSAIVTKTIQSGVPPKLLRMKSWAEVLDRLPHMGTDLLEAVLADREEVLGKGSSQELIRHL